MFRFTWAIIRELSVGIVAAYVTTKPITSTNDMYPKSTL